MGYDDLKVIEAAMFLDSIVDGEQREPGVREALAAARVVAAMERSAALGRLGAGGRRLALRLTKRALADLGDADGAALAPPSGAPRGRGRAPARPSTPVTDGGEPPRTGRSNAAHAAT